MRDFSPNRYLELFRLKQEKIEKDKNRRFDVSASNHHYHRQGRACVGSADANSSSS
jgi:hypothetical protein